MSDYILHVMNYVGESPEVFIASINEAMKAGIHRVEAEKDGCISYWFEPKDYEKYKDNWDEIGQGF